MKLKSFVSSFALGLTLVAGGVGAGGANGQESASATSSRKLKTRTTPEYPSLAKQFNVSGKVKLEVTIAPDGHVLSSKPVGGSPLLVGAAQESVKKWRYEPGPKETMEVVEFEFSSKQ